MFKIMVIKDGAEVETIPCDNFVIGATKPGEGDYVTRREGNMALCAFVTLALFAESIGELQRVPTGPAEASTD